MSVGPYSYASKRFSEARSALMLPHPEGEAQSIAMCFFDCKMGLTDIKREHLDDDAAAWVETLGEFMNTEGIEDPGGVGTYLLRARQLTTDDQMTLSRIVDELAHYFDRRTEEEWAARAKEARS
jgi:hypothetical protein